MAISFRRWLLGKLGAGSGTEVICTELAQALEEYRLRELAFHTCISMIANAVGRCEFKTCKGGEEYRGREYYLWNIEPNPNQNSTAFLHKLVYKLYSENEALVVDPWRQERLFVADSWQAPEEAPGKLREYRDVAIDGTICASPLPERDVLHFRLQHKNIKPALDGLCQAYSRLVQAAMKNYGWASGRHMKVHIDQIAQGGTVGGKDWNTVFTEMLEAQVKPFLTGENGLLPEFTGYQYTEVGGSPDANRTTRDIRALADDIFDFTARAFCIPPVLLFGDVAGTQDAMARWLTTCIDPLCDQIQEEIIRKRYGFAEWEKGNSLRIDTSSILHFDLFSNAAAVEKLIGSGAFSINDVRRAAGASAIQEDWADRHFVTKNFETVASAARQMEGSEEK